MPQQTAVYSPSRTSPAPRAHPLPIAINTPFSPISPPPNRRRARSKPQPVSPHLAHLPPRAHTRFQTVPCFLGQPASPAPRARPLPTAINAAFSPMPPRLQQTAVCSPSRTSPAPRAPTSHRRQCGLFADIAAQPPPPQATNPGLFHPSRTSPATRARPLPTAINTPFSPMPPCHNKPQSIPRLAHLPPPTRTPASHRNQCALFADAAAASNKPRSVSPTFPRTQKKKTHRLPQICGRAGASSLDHFTSEVYSAL